MHKFDLTKLLKNAEEFTNEEAVVEGNIPKWLKGDHIRVGPGHFDFGDHFSMNHWLDGYCVMSKFEISEGRVRFSQKFLQSEAYKRGLAANKPVIAEYGTRGYADPNKNFVSRIVSSLSIELTDNDSGSLFTINNDVFASSDTCFFRSISPSNLKTGERWDTNKLFGVNGVCAHPLKDTEGNTITVGYSCIPGTKINVLRIPSGTMKGSPMKEIFKKSEIICTFPTRWSGGFSYYHSFGLSKDYLVFIEQPLVVSLAKILASNIRGYSCNDWMKWIPADKTRFVVVNLKTQTYFADYFSESFFFLHVINCIQSESNDRLILDIITFDSPGILDTMFLNDLRSNNLKPCDRSSAKRFIIPIGISDVKSVQEGVNLLGGGTNSNNNNQMPKVGSQGLASWVPGSPSAIRDGSRIILTPLTLSGQGLEYPNIAPGLSTKPYKYFYGIGNSYGNSYSNSVIKVRVPDPVDNEYGSEESVWSWREDETNFPAEPIFIPNPESQGNQEDDGILISAVSKSPVGMDFLLFLDPATMKPLGKALFKHDIPQGLHGIWLPHSLTKK